jgi:SnoaL-like domain
MLVRAGNLEDGRVQTLSLTSAGHALVPRLFTLTADKATGETYCLAHHLAVEGGRRRLMAASLHYLDTFEKSGGTWLFAERRLNVDWLDERALS